MDNAHIQKPSTPVAISTQESPATSPPQAPRQKAIREWVETEERLKGRRRALYLASAGLGAIALLPQVPTISFLAMSLSTALAGTVMLHSFRTWLFNATCAKAGLSFSETKSLWLELGK